MENTIPKIYVIVVTYKGKQWYDRCFSSLRESTLPVQTIVVDNASNDGSVEFIKEHYPEILLIESKENMGFGKGNNLALRYAYEHGCDYVFLLNQDAWLEDGDALNKLVLLSLRHPEYGIISPMHIAPDKQSLNMMLEYGSNVYSKRILSDLYCGKRKEIYQTNYVNAAAWLISRNTLSILGGFDPLIFHYGEDDDYLNRARYHGVKVGISLESRIVHDHQSGEFKAWSSELARKSAVDDLELFLDLNTPFNYHALRMTWMRRYIKSLLRGRAKEREIALYKMKYLRKMRYSIENSRRMNMIKQPNWIQ
ncbi:MAG: glycosyltransferase family 2 protein [Bacteroidales bacterium]|nr:glycosyltransferase family 2 protein [Bacteroidales bacterium]